MLDYLADHPNQKAGEYAYHPSISGLKGTYQLPGPTKLLTHKLVAHPPSRADGFPRKIHECPLKRGPSQKGISFSNH